MGRREAEEAVRMARFLTLHHRWESAELNQAEAAELLGVSERTFRRWTRRYEEDGEAGILDGRLGKASGRRVPADRAEEVERLYRERYQGFTVKHFHEHLDWQGPRLWLGLHLVDQQHLQWAGVAPKAPRKGAHRRKRERCPLPGMMLASGRLAAIQMARGRTAARPDRHNGRCDGGDLFGFSRRGGRNRLDLQGLKRGFLAAWPADEPLHRSRGALLSHPESWRRDRSGSSDPGRAGARAIGRRAYRGLFAA